MRRTMTLLAVLFTVGLPGQAQDPGAAYDVEVTRVVMDVVVLDRDGRPIPGLTRDDFVVEDEGDPTEVLDVVEERHALDGAPAAGAAPGTKVVAPPGRHIVAVFDAVKLEPQGTARAKAALRDLIREGLAPSDRLSVIRVGHRVEVISGPTADRRRLLGLLAPEDEPVAGIVPMDESTLPIPSELDREKRLYGALEALGKSLEAEPGRKLLFVFTDLDALFVPPSDVDPPRGGRGRNQARMIDRARRYEAVVDSLNASNVAVFTVSRLNRGPAMAGADERSTGPELLGEVEAAETSRSMAAATGGASVTGAVNLPEKLRRLSEMTMTSYLVTFEPRRSGGEGVRDVRVRVRREGARVLARRGYVPPVPFAAMDREQRDAQLALAARTWRDADGLPFEMAAEARPDAGRHFITLRAKVDRALLMAGNAGRRLDVYCLVSHDHRDKKLDEHRDALPVASGQGTETYEKTIDVGPGTYTLRLVLRDAVSGTLGTRTVTVTVPDEPAAR